MEKEEHKITLHYFCTENNQEAVMTFPYERLDTGELKAHIEAQFDPKVDEHTEDPLGIFQAIFSKFTQPK